MPALTKRRANDKRPRGDYYERNAGAYAAATRNVDVSNLYGEFLPFVRPGGRVLDAGSGSGRDTRAFRGRGYEVDAFDASPKLAALSEFFTGVPTRVLRFQEFDSPPVYDGIWACASLLHVPQAELVEVMGRLVAALKSGGALYLSVKHGSGERIADDGRVFLDLDRNDLEQLFRRFPDMSLAKVWLSSGEGVRQGKDEWINAIAVKNQAGEGP